MRMLVLLLWICLLLREAFGATWCLACWNATGLKTCPVILAITSALPVLLEIL